jgi:hypothetical protein
LAFHVQIEIQRVSHNYLIGIAVAFALAASSNAGKDKAIS